MKGKIKKILAGALALCMTVSTLTPAIGAEAAEVSGDLSGSIEGDGEVKEVEVTMAVGESAIYEGTINGESTGSCVSAEAIQTYYQEITAEEIQSGEQYLIVSANQNAIVKTTAGTHSSWSGKTGLLFDTDEVAFVNKDYSAYLWTFTEVEDASEKSYTISYHETMEENETDTDKYIKLSGNGQLELIAKDGEESALPSYTLMGKSGGYVIKQAGTALTLNNLGGINHNQLASAWNDESSYWHLYKPGKTPATIVEATAYGKVTLRIGDTKYHITVKEAEGTYQSFVYLKKGETAKRYTQGAYDPENTVIAEGYDTSIVQASCKKVESGQISNTQEEQKMEVTFTGIDVGRTVVDAGANRYYVYVLDAAGTEPEVRTETITLEVGESKVLRLEGIAGESPAWGTDYESYLGDTDVFSISEDVLAIRGNEVITYEGISRYYAGDPVELSDCLYTFTKGANGGYYISGETSEGQTVYINPEDAGIPSAHTTYSNKEIQLIAVDGKEGVFYLQDNNIRLYFGRTDGDLFNRLDRGNTTGTGEGYEFELYRMAKESEKEGNTEIPGYVKVCDLTNLDGEQCLIVASYTRNDKKAYYALFPSLEKKDNDHPMQTVHIITDQKVEHQVTEVSLTGKATGTTTLKIGNVTYEITVLEAAASYIQNVYLEVGGTKTCTKQGAYNPNTQLSDTYDKTVVQASLSNAENTTQVTFQGLSEGRTVVDAGSDRFYVYVLAKEEAAEPQEEDITLYVGQKTSFYVNEDGIETGEQFGEYVKNYSAVSGRSDLLAVRGNEIAAKGTVSNGYVGDLVDLSECLYTFEKTGDDYRITALDAEGNLLYLNHDDAGIGKANTTSPGSISIEEAQEGTFYLNDKRANGTSRYLYFHRSGEKVNRWDAQGSKAGACEFFLYRRADVQAVSENGEELPGYVRVTSKEELKDGMQCLIVAAYEADSEMQYYALYPSTEYSSAQESGSHLQSVQIIPTEQWAHAFAAVSFTGAKAGETTLKVGNKTYHISVLEQPEEATVESTPFISATGKSAGYPVTALYMTSDRTFKLLTGNGYVGEAVWEIEQGTVTDAAGNPVTDPDWSAIQMTDGTISANAENHTYTYSGWIKVTIGDASYKIPFRISPAPSQDAKKSVDLYVRDIHETIVYSGWLYPEQNESGDVTYHATTLEKVREGQVFYTDMAGNLGLALDFFAVGEDGYALANMGATGSQGHYKRLDAEKAEETEFCTQDGVAGQQQMKGIDAEATKTLVQQAIDGVTVDGKHIKFVGAQGFTRFASDSQSVSTIVDFVSERLPSVDKQIRGIWSAARGYRDYVEGMAVTAGETIIYNIDVQTYDMYNKDNEIIYEEVSLKENLEHAYFITSPDRVAEDMKEQKTTLAITEDIEKDKTTGTVHRYYAGYVVTAKDVADGKNIVNTVGLESTLRTKYQKTSEESQANAKATVLLASNEWKNLVVDFGLSVEKEETVTTKEVNYSIPSESLTTYGKVTTTLEPHYNSAQELEAYQITATYTPDKILQGADAVTLTDSLGNAHLFYVYPASSVYYEEGFADYSGDWGENISKGTGFQQLQVISGTAAETTGSADSAQFGYDDTYAKEAVGPSNGSEAVSSRAGNGAEFTFTGTGVDIYANCAGGEDRTGTISVLVKNAKGKVEKLLIVDTHVEGSSSEGDPTAAQNSMKNAYSLPVVSIGGLEHGSHTVSIRHTRTKAEVDENTTYPVKLDGFRVYNTLKEQDVYEEFGEKDPYFSEVRNGVLGALDLKEILKGDAEVTEEQKSVYAEDIAKGLKQVYDQTEAESAIYAAGKAVILSGQTSVVTNAKDLLDNGPKNEVYLYNGQSLVMKLNGGLKNVQIGLKAVMKEVSVMSVQKSSGGTVETLAVPTKITSSTDLFYKIDDIEEETTITITNSSDGVLSVTDLKYFKDSTEGTESAGVFASLSEEDFIPSLKNMGYQVKTEETSGETPEEPAVTRIYGENRYETAYAIADALKKQLGIEAYEAVVIATGEKAADALSGSYLAVKENAPILLTDGSEKVNGQLIDYLRKNAKEHAAVYILGETGAVSQQVQDLLTEAGYAVERLGGASRYETNLKILEKAGIDEKEIIVATGTKFADSLSASAAGKPVLLVKDTLNAAQKELLAQVSGGKIYIIGGERAVSAALAEELSGFGAVERIHGADRYETSVKAAEMFFANAEEAVIANAVKPYDGLCGGPLAAAANVPLILTKDGRTEDAAAYAQKKDITSGYVLGGDGALADQTVTEIFKTEQIRGFVYRSENE